MGAPAEQAGGAAGARVRLRGKVPAEPRETAEFSPAKRARADEGEAAVPAHWPQGCVPDPKANVTWLPLGWTAARKLTSGGKMGRCYISPKGELAWHKEKVEKLEGRSLGPPERSSGAQAADVALPRDGETGTAAAGAPGASPTPPAAASAAEVPPAAEALRMLDGLRHVEEPEGKECVGTPPPGPTAGRSAAAAAKPLSAPLTAEKQPRTAKAASSVGPGSATSGARVPASGAGAPPGEAKVAPAVAAPPSLPQPAAKEGRCQKARSGSSECTFQEALDPRAGLGGDGHRAPPPLRPPRPPVDVAKRGSGDCGRWRGGMPVFMDPITEFSAFMVVVIIAVPAILMMCCILEECPLVLGKGATLEDVPFFCGLAMSDCTSPATASLVCFFFVVFVLIFFSATSSFFLMLWRGSVLEKQSGDVDLPDTISNLALLQMTGPLVRGGVAVAGSHLQAHAALSAAAALLNASHAAAAAPPGAPAGRLAVAPPPAAAAPRAAPPSAAAPPGAAAAALLGRTRGEAGLRRGRRQRREPPGAPDVDARELALPAWGWGGPLSPFE